MLKIHFINVAGGDACLLQYDKEGIVHNILIDAGRKKVPPEEGSLRTTCAAFLGELGVTHIDLLVLTHLHMDHFGGIEAVLDAATVDDFYGCYLPQDASLRLPKPEKEDPAYKLKRALGDYALLLEKMSSSGTALHACLEDGILLDDGVIQVKVMTANANSVQGQHIIYENVLRGIVLPQDLTDWAQSSANANSLRVVVTYAGRTIRLDGDHPGKLAEKEAVTSCDIYKVAHHSNPDALTGKLAERLRPMHAVISVQNVYNPQKDKPCKRVADQLREVGARVYYTDSYQEPGHKVILRKEVVFTIQEDGHIIFPEEN